MNAKQCAESGQRDRKADGRLCRLRLLVSLPAKTQRRKTLVTRTTARAAGTGWKCQKPNTVVFNL